MQTVNSRSILWFRHGLRLHDNPALLEAIKPENNQPVSFCPIFIFDGESAGTEIISYNRLKYLLESLEDLDVQFRKKGGRLYLFQGKPVDIFRKLWEKLGINKVCYEQDCEPIWEKRDQSVVSLCTDLRIRCFEKVSHTLWHPYQVIQTNGGFPPLTYQMFLHTVGVLGNPPRPVEDPLFENVIFSEIPDDILKELHAFDKVPTCEDLNVYRENTGSVMTQNWKGGEKRALQLLEKRMQVEENAFKMGFYLPNQANPDILGASTSMSAALRHGCLSVRTFFYRIHDTYKLGHDQNIFKCPAGSHITGQLIWREYFYTMSVNNCNYDRMANNPICLNIPWAEPNGDTVEKWKKGQTGYPLIDAAMRQLLAEGWLHHTLRNITATFLTRGALWLDWEIGEKHFRKHLIDADWSVNAGNWMWVSSSAFEKLLDSSKCTCPISFGRRLDPHGEYIRRYVPELRKVPTMYIHEPWLTPIAMQKEIECVIGIHYPEPIIDLSLASKRNSDAMRKIRETLLSTSPHVRPSDENEIRNFFWLAEEHAIKVQ